MAIDTRVVPKALNNVLVAGAGRNFLSGTFFCSQIHDVCIYDRVVRPHAVAPCKSCHPGAPAGQFCGTPLACGLCHHAELAQATFPDHAASGWTTGCERCHIPTSTRSPCGSADHTGKRRSGGGSGRH